jgi:hypothetical protein
MSIIHTYNTVSQDSSSLNISGDGLGNDVIFTIHQILLLV